MNLEEFLRSFADQVAARVIERMVAPRSDHRRLLTITEAAQLLGRSKASVQHLIAQRRLPVVRDERRVFIDLRDLDRWIAEHKEPEQAAA